MNNNEVQPCHPSCSHPLVKLHQRKGCMEYALICTQKCHLKNPPQHLKKPHQEFVQDQLKNLIKNNTDHHNRIIRDLKKSVVNDYGIVEEALKQNMGKLIEKIDDLFLEKIESQNSESYSRSFEKLNDRNKIRYLSCHEVHCLRYFQPSLSVPAKVKIQEISLKIRSGILNLVNSLNQSNKQIEQILQTEIDHSIERRKKAYLANPVSQKGNNPQNPNKQQTQINNQQEPPKFVNSQSVTEQNKKTNNPIPSENKNLEHPMQLEKIKQNKNKEQQKKVQSMQEQKKNHKMEEEKKKSQPMEEEKKKSQPMEEEKKKSQPMEEEKKKSQPMEEEKKKYQPMEGEKKKQQPMEEEKKKHKSMEEQKPYNATVTSKNPKTIQNEQVPRKYQNAFQSLVQNFKRQQSLKQKQRQNQKQRQKNEGQIRKKVNVTVETQNFHIQTKLQSFYRQEKPHSERKEELKREVSNQTSSIGSFMKQRKSMLQGQSYNLFGRIVKKEDNIVNTHPKQNSQVISQIPASQLKQTSSMNPTQKTSSNPFQGMSNNPVKDKPHNPIQNILSNPIKSIPTNSAQIGKVKALQNIPVDTAMTIETKGVQNIETKTVKSLEEEPKKQIQSKQTTNKIPISVLTNNTVSFMQVQKSQQIQPNKNSIQTRNQLPYKQSQNPKNTFNSLITPENPTKTINQTDINSKQSRPLHQKQYSKTDPNSSNQSLPKVQNVNLPKVQNVNLPRESSTHQFNIQNKGALVRVSESQNEINKSVFLLRQQRDFQSKQKNQRAGSFLPKTSAYSLQNTNLAQNDLISKTTEQMKSPPQHPQHQNKIENKSEVQQLKGDSQRNTKSPIKNIPMFANPIGSRRPSIPTKPTEAVIAEVFQRVEKINQIKREKEEQLNKSSPHGELPTSTGQSFHPKPTSQLIDMNVKLQDRQKNQNTKGQVQPTNQQRSERDMKSEMGMSGNEGATSFHKKLNFNNDRYTSNLPNQFRENPQ